MEGVNILGCYASVSGIIAAFTIASAPGRKWMVMAFGLFLTSSLTWIVADFMDSVNAIAIQNIDLPVVNAWGIYRWMRLPAGNH